MGKKQITVKSNVQAPIEKVWLYWTTPEHIKNWNQASSDWYTPAAENELRKNGKFSFRMEAKDGSAGFDFEGVYDEVEPQKFIAYTLGDGRKVNISFNHDGDQTTITENFEADDSHSEEQQREGWQAILDQFKKYVEKQ